MTWSWGSPDHIAANMSGDDEFRRERATGVLPTLPPQKPPLIPGCLKVCIPVNDIRDSYFIVVKKIMIYERFKTCLRNEKSGQCFLTERFSRFSRILKWQPLRVALCFLKKCVRPIHLDI